LFLKAVTSQSGGTLDPFGYAHQVFHEKIHLALLAAAKVVDVNTLRMNAEVRFWRNALAWTD